jgi:hypothetical protein
MKIGFTRASLELYSDFDDNEAVNHAEACGPEADIAVVLSAPVLIVNSTTEDQVLV